MNVRNRRIQLIAVAAMLAAAVCAVRPALAQNSAACRSVAFSADVLARFPNAPQECLDVITRDGQQYAVFKAQLIRVDGDRLRVRVKQPDGSLAEAITIKPRKKVRVLVDGKATDATDLASDQELTAYVRVDKPVIALAPAVATEPLDLVPIVPTAVTPPLVAARPVMPKTAGQSGLLALLAVLSLLVATVSVLLRVVVLRSLGLRRST
ncbi:MAG TPA: hypothetical protein VGM84_13875 [Steroidobacteraceae bacterium]|jgi:hypothetical protein